MSNSPNSLSKNAFRVNLKRWLPVSLLLVAFTAFFASGLHQRLTLDELALRFTDLSQFIETNFWLSVVVAIFSYIVVTAASLPVAVLLSVTIGLVFGWASGSVIIVIGATLGAALLFIAARFLLVDFFRQRAGDRLNAMASGFREDAVSYMLFLRLAAIFPFFMVNIVPAILDVRFSVFLWTTAVGIIPGTIAFAFAGEGLRSIILERAQACAQDIAPCGQPFSLADIVTREMLIAFILLSLTALLPVLLKKMRKKTKSI